MQRQFGLSKNHLSPTFKMLIITQTAITFINSHPVLKFIEGGWNILVPSLSLVISLMMGLMISDYNSIQQTVSQMVHYPNGWLLTTDFFVLAIWLFFLAVKFYFIFGHLQTTKFSSLLFLLMAIGFVLIAIFPTTMDGATKGNAAQIHEFVARVVSVLFPVACLALLPELCIQRKNRWLAIYTLFTGLAGLVCVIICTTVIFGEGISLGLFERMLMANALFWGLIVSLRLFPMYQN